jgi:hypothetical protein
MPLRSLSLATWLLAGGSFAQEPECSITLDEFSALWVGMTYEQAQEVIGCPGVVMARTVTPGISTVIITWQGVGTIGANAIVGFQNDAIVTVGQFGLR